MMMTDPRNTATAGHRPMILALLVAGSFFMENLDATVITTALPAIGQSFHVPAVDLNIGISAYLLTLAVFIPASGWIADRFGPRQVFTGAILLFTLASVLCGMADGLWPFTAARALQGIGGALMVPVGRLVVLRVTPKNDLMRAIAWLTWPALVAPILGPPIGGFLTTYADWRWIFLLNVPLGLIAAVLAWRLIDHRQDTRPPPFDWVGFASTGGASLGLMAGLELIGQGGRVSGAALVLPLGLTGLSLLLGLLAIRHCRRAAQPLIRLDALRIRSFAVTIWGGSLFRAVVMALPFLLPLMFQIAFGLDAFQAGGLVLAVFLGNMMMKPGTRLVLRRFGFRTTLIGNGLLFAATVFACALIERDTPAAVSFAVMFLSGLTRSMQFTALNTIAFADVPKSAVSPANTLFTMCQQMATGLGITLSALLLTLAEGWLGPGSGAFHAVFIVLGLCALLSVADSLTLHPTTGNEVSGHPAK